MNMLTELNRELISVVVPCYNQAIFLHESVESIISQSYSNFEIIVVNDGSTDDTSFVANALITEYPDYSIRLIEKKNGGVASARNMGISLSKGEFILTLDADDKIHPDFMRKCSGLLNDNLDISIAYTDYQHFGDVDLIVNTPEYDFQVLYSQKCLHTATALFRKKAWIDAGGYNSNLIWGAEDWEFWIKCGNMGHFGKRVPEVLFYYRTRLSEVSRIKESNVHSNELYSRMVLNNLNLYDPARIAWAKNTWTDALTKMLESSIKGTKEYSYLCNLDAIKLISEAELLTEIGRKNKAIDLLKIWLLQSTSQLNYAVYFNLGVYLTQENRINEAIEAYSNSLLANPNFALSRENLDKLSKCNNFGDSWININFDFECEIHHCFPRSGGNKTAFKVLNIATEPSVWCISSEDLRKVSHNFDLILTYRDDLADLPNVRFMVYGGCFIHGIPQVKRFEVSFLYSVGLNNNMLGYELRKRVWDIRKSLPQTFKYFSSSIRPPAENDNPWPYKVKDKLFESMFSLIIENTAEKNYFTEKIIDAFQTYTVPIYWGAANIADYFDINGIICFNDIDDLKQIIENLTVDNYYKRLESVVINYNRSMKYIDILSNMKHEIDETYYALADKSVFFLSSE
jgi:glycosyltransferase involved in cell wall biosynthesis